MALTSTIGLFEVDPDFSRYVPPDERVRAGHMRLPLADLPPGDVDVRALLRSAGSFAAVLIDGMLVQSMRLEGRCGLRVLGPGSVLSLAETAPSILIEASTVRATVPGRAAMLGKDFLIASRHWPWLVAGLNARYTEQSRALANQLMICQLPRVDDRLLAMMWLLAEAWGKVSSSGTVLPVQLTHSVLGGLIGARRPTVSLALRALTDNGSLLRQSDGWLLLKPPASGMAGTPEASVVDPRPVDIPETVSAIVEQPAAHVSYTDPDGERVTQLRISRDAVAYAELRATVSRLRAEHDVYRRRVHDHLEAMTASRISASQRRERLAQQRRMEAERDRLADAVGGS